MRDRPFSDVCSTVSCWALLFTVILPSMQVLGVKITTNEPSLMPNPDSRQQHPHQHQLHFEQLQHLAHHRQHSVFKSQTFSLTVYLESSPQELFSLSFLTNPSVQSPSLRRRPSHGLSSQHVQSQQDQQHQQVVKVRAHASSKGERSRSKRFSSTSQQQRSARKRDTRHYVQTVVMSKDAASSGSSSSQGFSVNLETTTAYGNGPRRPSRHRYPHALVQKMYEEYPSTSTAAPMTTSPARQQGFQQRHSVDPSEDSTSEQDSPSSLSSSSSSSPSALSGNNDERSMRALWDYQEDLDGLERVQMRKNGQSSGQFENVILRGRRSDSLPFSKDTLWKGRVEPVNVSSSRKNMSFASAWLQDDISGPIVRFPLSAPMPTMPHQWVALMPCALKSVVDHAILQLDASAIILFPTSDGDCSAIPALRDTSVPLLIMDQMAAEKLNFALDSLSYGTMALAALSRTKKTPETDVIMTKTKIATMDTTALDEESAERAQETMPYTVAATPYRTIQGHAKQRQVVLALPGIASMVDCFTSEAAIRVRRVLVNLGLEARSQSFTGDSWKEQVAFENNDLKGDADTMVSTSYLPPSSASFNKHDWTKLEHYEPDAGPLTARDEETLDTMTVDMATPPPTSMAEDEAAGSVAAVSRHHPKARTRPNRLVQRVHRILPSQMLDEVQPFIMIREVHRHNSILNTLWNSNYLHYHDSSTTSISGKLAMVLMSTVCGVGVGMFGALLFVVALKVRLFRSRRSSQHSSHPHQAAGQQQQTQQQLRESGLKKVLPKGVLESYGIQTVLETSVSSVTLTRISEKTSSGASALTKGRLVCAEDVIEMEEGLHRRDRTGSANSLLGVGHGECDCDHGDYDDDDDDDEESAAGENEDEDEDESEEPMEDNIENAFELHMEGSGEAHSIADRMDMEQITAAITTASRRDDFETALDYSSVNVLSAPTSPSSSSSSISSSVSLSRSLSEKTKDHCCPSHGHRKKKAGAMPFANANAQTLCAICLGEYEVGEQVRTLPCFHQYHVGCIDPWLLNVVSLCPICKRDLCPKS